MAEAITVHKSQGATYANVAVHTRNRMTRAALYVACSRATNASGLFIFGSFNPPKPFQNSDPVKIELENLNNNKKLKLNFDFMKLEEKDIKIFFQNIQSFRANKEDINTDYNLINSNFLCFVETWTLPGESCSIMEFSEVSRIDCVKSAQENTRNKSGIIIFSRSNIVNDVRIILKRDYSQGSQTLQIIAFKYRDIILMVLYRNPSFDNCYSSL